MWKQKQMKQILKLKEPFINYEKILRDSPPKIWQKGKALFEVGVRVRWNFWWLLIASLEDEMHTALMYNSSKHIEIREIL